ncbi:transcriptional regulator [Rhizobium sp. PP-CC-2G-626]|nr:transcriptional regulator [Rhizobium sp. PP-CC-2G-626]
MSHSVSCPCCGQNLVSSLPAAGLKNVRFYGSTQTLVLHALAEAYPRGMTKEQLFDVIYSENPDGGPLYGPNIIAIHIGKLRPKIEQLGWTIPHNAVGAGNFGSYRLAPIGGAA